MPSSKMIIRPALSVEIGWSVKHSCFYFRLFNGDRAATPPLKMDAYDMNLLEQGSRVDLCDKTGKKWVQLTSTRRKIGIIFDSHHGKGIESDFLAGWPDIVFEDFMSNASHLRGAHASKGWEKILEAMMEEQREDWPT